MGGWLDVPEWVFWTAFVLFGLSVWMGIGYWTIGNAHKRVAARRPNPTQKEFLTMMEGECSPEIAQFLWGKALFYVTPRLTPHPDDHLFDDLKIDEDDVSIDWPREWAELQGFHESNLPDWPDGWDVDVRNFGRWLNLGHR